MLARPKLGTREHMLLWLAAKAPDETYEWESYEDCACGTYARETMDKSNWWWREFGGKPFAWLNMLACHTPHTYGALYKRARKAHEREQ